MGFTTKTSSRLSFLICSVASSFLAVDLAAQSVPGESPALTPPRITQQMIVGGQLGFAAIRKHGLRIFASAYNKLDGHGDGPMNKPGDPTNPSGRPTLQNNGTFLRVNGLDAQTCVECHSFRSTATMPFTFAIGGHGGGNNNALAGATEIDVDDSMNNRFAFFNGRLINPPFLFGAGGVELVAKEMTIELQQRKARAQLHPGTPVPLVAKGIDFGTIVYSNGAFDTSGVAGVAPDLVVRPFGRKGEFATTRDFDIGAMQFHLGMQPVEVVGAGVDDDGDGVADEMMIGEMSALSVFTTTQAAPVTAKSTLSSQRGGQLFSRIGCAVCHTPVIDTDRSILTYSFPEVPTDPSVNIYFGVDLRQKPVSFKPSPKGGIRVPMFSDLKRHDMGPGLAESTGNALDPFFVTARLWGIADTPPYLHDGRATSLTEAILLHGGEGQAARDSFAALIPQDRIDVLTFLRTLRTPPRPKTHDGR